MLFFVSFLTFKLLAKIIKTILSIKNISTLRWLVTIERTELNRENDSNFTVGLVKIKKIGNAFTILMWIVAIFAVSTTAFTSIWISSKNKIESKEACKKVSENLFLVQTSLNYSQCEKPVKHFPWLTKTPYDNQVSPNYELTLFFELLAIYYCAMSLLPIDMILMTMMLYIKFQFEMINMDLVRSFLMHALQI